MSIASEIDVTATGRQLGIKPSAISNWIHRKPKAIADTMGLNDDEVRDENNR